MKSIVHYPPSWCPDAIPSDRGWRHPVTGELLVSVKGGVKPIKKDITKDSDSQEKVTENPHQKNSEPKQNLENETKKRKSSRKRKNQDESKTISENVEVQK